MDTLELEFNHWKPVSEDFLYEKFVNDDTPTKPERDIMQVDPSKVHFVSTPYDRYYYKNKFNFDEELCVILEKCSIEKMKVAKKRQKATKPKKKTAIDVRHEKTFIFFD